MTTPPTQEERATMVLIGILFLGGVVVGVIGLLFGSSHEPLDLSRCSVNGWGVLYDC
jgi:hypothetical protein